MLRSLVVLIVVATLHSESVFAQNPDGQVDSALALLKSGRPQEASLVLQVFLTPVTLSEVPRATQARAYTYLAMSEWLLYRRQGAEAAVTAALSSDASSFLTFGADWAKQNATVLDSVVYRLLDRSVALYQDAEYDASVRQLSELSAIQRILPAVFAAEVHKYLAFNLIAQRHTDLAHREFEAAIRLNPRLEIGDESVVSPKIRRLFFGVQDNSLTKTLTRSSRRTVLRSVLAPGWGQIQRGSKTRGYFYAGLQAGLLTGSLLSVRSFYKARNAYAGFGPDDALNLFAQTNSVDAVKAAVSSRFSRYQSAGKRANIMVGLFAGAWAVNVVDAMILAWRRDGIAKTDARGGANFGGKLAWNPELRMLQAQYGVYW